MKLVKHVQISQLIVVIHVMKINFYKSINVWITVRKVIIRIPKKLAIFVIQNVLHVRMFLLNAILAIVISIFIWQKTLV